MAGLGPHIHLEDLKGQHDIFMHITFVDFKYIAFCFYACKYSAQIFSLFSNRK